MTNTDLSRNFLSPEDVEFLKARSELVHFSTANLAHDVRPPLAYLFGCSELLRNNKNGTLSPKEIEYVEKIQKAANEGRADISKLLLIAREAGNMQVDTTEEIDLQRLIQDITDANSIEINQKPPDNLPALRADRAGLTLVLLSLIDLPYAEFERTASIIVATNSNNVSIQIYVQANQVFKIYPNSPALKYCTALIEMQKGRLRWEERSEKEIVFEIILHLR